MVIRAAQFNLYLWLGLALVLSGCKSDDKEKPRAALEVHLEVGSHDSALSTSVPIYRAQPVMVTVDETPFLSDADVARAWLVDVPGGFVIKIQFSEHGVMALSQYSLTNPGRHFVIHAQFGTSKKNMKNRWLAAPLIPRHIENGVLVFTPDADREESQIIVDALNNTAGVPKDDKKKGN